jgi:hypothetical protein
VFGPASDAGFGSATFAVAGGADLAAIALATYRRFVRREVGWLGEAAWMGTRRVYARPSGGPRDVVAEFSALPDREAKSSAGVMMDGSRSPRAGRPCSPRRSTRRTSRGSRSTTSGTARRCRGDARGCARAFGSGDDVVAFLLD